MKREDRAKDPAPADFIRNRKPATYDALVEFLTCYSRMIVSAEEVERQLLAAYGPDRLPGTESRRRSNLGLSHRDLEPRTCAQCGEPLTWRYRFCSQSCWTEWHVDHPVPVASAEVQAEMQAALADLAAYIEEVTPRDV